MPTFWRVFIINGCWILSKAFSASIEMTIWFLFFNLLIWCITLICCQCLCPRSELQLPPASAGDPPILTGRSGPVSYEVISFFPGFWCTWNLVCALQEWSFCFPQSWGIPAIKPLWSSKSNSLGAPPPFVRPSGWGAWRGAQNFHSYGRTSGIIIFQFVGHPPSRYGIWFYCDCTPPTILLWLLLCLWM